MSRKPYRIEVTYPKDRNPQYYLVKDIKLRDKKSKVRIYLKSSEQALTKEEKEYYSKKYGYKLELKAAAAVGKIGSENFKTEYLLQDQIKSLEEIRYLNRRSIEILTKNELDAYEQNFEIHYVQGTTSIEGNTLTLGQTNDLLLYGIIPKNKSLREINEVQNFKNVKKYRDSYKGNVNIRFIKSLHALTMQNIDNVSAGNFRRTEVEITGCEAPICASIGIESRLNEIIDYYYKRIKEGYHPFEEAVMFHYFFEITHPFSDGNGRVGREIFNYMLSRTKYPKLLFLGKDRIEYIEALKMGNVCDYHGMVSTFADIIIDQRQRILREKLKELLEKPEDKRQTTLWSWIDAER
jgi:Fic family protein